MAGRPTSLNEKLGNQVCAHIADGLSLRQIEKLDGMPARTTIKNWVTQANYGNETYRAFHVQYARACEMRAEIWAEELLEIADNGTNDIIEKENDDGSTYEVTNHDHINRSRLRVDTRKWLLSKVLPKVYGDRVHQEITGKDGSAFTAALNITIEKKG